MESTGRRTKRHRTAADGTEISARRALSKEIDGVSTLSYVLCPCVCAGGSL